MRLAFNLGLELRTLADRVLSGVVANRFIDGHICSPFWLHSGRKRNGTALQSFLPKSWKPNGSRLMSRAFVKDADYLEELPERPISERPNDVKRLGADRTCPRSGQRSLRRRASISRSRGPCRRGARPSLLVRPARDCARRTGPDRPLRSTVWHVSDDRTRRWQGADVSDRRRRRSRPRQRLDLTCLAAGEIDVRKARRRRGQSRQRGSK
jgi:hypothetical protein